MQVKMSQKDSSLYEYENVIITDEDLLLLAAEKARSNYTEIYNIHSAEVINLKP